jgi:hypothetical protein
MDLKHASPGHNEHDACEGLPEFKRLNYFYGQMLGVGDFRAEQAYFREKLKLHNRCLHGYGTVCGLRVVTRPGREDCESDSDGQRRELEAQLRKIVMEVDQLRRAGKEDDARRLERQAEDIKRKLESLPAGHCEPPEASLAWIECGVALDCHGNEIVVRRPLAVDPWHYLSAEDRKRVESRGNEGFTVFVSICYCEQPVDPVRPVMPNACGATDDCAYGKLRDAFRVRVTLEPPREDTRCETCCTPCDECCLLLASIRGFRKDTVIEQDTIDNSVRRLVETSHAATTITSISWTHGATYTSEEVGRILGANEVSHGIKVTFSRPVLTSTLAPGVVDLWVIEGGRTNRAGVFYLEGDFDGLDPNQRLVDSFRYRYVGDETLDPGDRVMVTIRTPFILDECCRSVAGFNNGRIPIRDAEFHDFEKPAVSTECAVKPPGYGPWTSAPETAGGGFESWFYVQSKGKAAEAKK